MGALLAVTAALDAGPASRRASASPPAQPTSAATVAIRPGVNGSTRPPFAAAAQRAVERLAITPTRSRTVATRTAADAHLFGPVEETALAPAEQERSTDQ